MAVPDDRTVLAIAYFFPPVGGAGAQRTLKFVKYLPEHGYRPVVLSTAARDYPARDPTLVGDIPPGTPVVRARDPRLLRLARTGFDFLDLALPRALAGWPDEAAAWIVPAAASALRLIRRHRPGLVFSSAPPFSVHLVGWLAARAAGVPWVADFRDEFTANPHAEGRVAAVQRISAALERRAVRQADRIVTVADYFEIAGAPRADPRRVTIVNGVDPADVPAAPDSPARAADGRFRLSFVGTLYGDRDLAPVAPALARLAERGEIDPDRCVLRLVGSMWLAAAPDAGTVAVEQTGYVSHAEALREMATASVLVFYAPATSPAPSGKIYEYLACERPVLCVARADNLAFQLVREWGAGEAAEPGDPAAIEAAILALYRRWLEGGPLRLSGVREQVLARYSRRALAGELAAVFDEAISEATIPASSSIARV